MYLPHWIHSLWRFLQSPCSASSSASLAFTLPGACRADAAAPRSAPQHSAASSEPEPRRTNARGTAASHARLAPPPSASHWPPDTAPSNYWTAENAAHLPGFDWSKWKTMPAHLFQKFQLMIGLNVCPFAPPSLETPSSDWLRKRWSRLDFDPKMNSSYVARSPSQATRGLFTMASAPFVHWLSGQPFWPVLVSEGLPMPSTG